MFENRVLRNACGPKRDQGTGENCMIRSFSAVKGGKSGRTVKSIYGW